MRTKRDPSPMMYAFGMLAIMIPTQAFNSFHSYFYVEKLGLGLGLATLARTIYLIWDAANQPLFGYWSDRTNTKYGRRKPWMIGAIPVFMLSFIMIFSVPGTIVEQEQRLFAWFLAALILFEAAATVLWVNYGALFPELFRGNRLRAKASAVQQGYQVAALLIGSALTPILYEALGFSSMSVIYALVFALLMLIFLMTTREDEEARSAAPLKMGEAFRATLRNQPFWLFNIANSFAQTVNGLLGSMIPFYAKYVLKIPEGQVTVLMASIFVSVIPLVAVWYGLVRRMDPVKGWQMSLAAYGLSVIPLWFGSGLWGGVAAGILVGFGLAGFLVTPPIVSSIIIDLDAERTGRRREGIYTAVAGFITRSSGLVSALAFLIVGLLFGYESGDNPGPNPEMTFRVLISAVPFCLLACSVLVSLFVKLEETSGKGEGR